MVSWSRLEVSGDIACISMIFRDLLLCKSCLHLPDYSFALFCHKMSGLREVGPSRAGLSPWDIDWRGALTLPLNAGFYHTQEHSQEFHPNWEPIVEGAGGSVGEWLSWKWWWLDFNLNAFPSGPHLSSGPNNNSNRLWVHTSEGQPV